MPAHNLRSLPCHHALPRPPHLALPQDFLCELHQAKGGGTQPFLTATPNSERVGASSLLRANLSIPPRVRGSPEHPPAPKQPSPGSPRLHQHRPSSPSTKSGQLQGTPPARTAGNSLLLKRPSLLPHPHEASQSSFVGLRPLRWLETP